MLQLVAYFKHIFSLSLYLIKLRYIAAIILIICSIKTISSSTINDTSTTLSSHVTILGTTTINQFKLTSRDLVVTTPSHNQKNYEINIPVEGFHCKNSNITSDFRELVKAKTYPFITISIDASHLNLKYIQQSGHLESIINLAGRSKETNIDYSISPSNDKQMIIEGNASLKLSCFSLEPPRKLLGMIKVNDEIFVNFVFYIDTL